MSQIKNNEEIIKKDDRFFLCSFCNRMFRLWHSLQIHTRTHTKEKPFPCKYCRIPFSDRTNLIVHVRRKHELFDRPYSCDICDKKFCESSSLKRHRLIHFKFRRYQCEVCEQKLVNKCGVKMHIKTQKHLENLAKCLKINPTVAKEIIKVKDESENILKMIEQNGFIKEIGQKVEAMEGESRAALLGGKRKQSFQKKKKSSSFIKADKRVRSLYDSSESEYIPDKEEVYKKFSLPVKTENETLEIVKPSINLNLFEIGLRLTNEEIEEDVMMIQDAIETYEMFLVKNTIIVKNTRTLN